MNKSSKPHPNLETTRDRVTSHESTPKATRKCKLSLIGLGVMLLALYSTTTFSAILTGEIRLPAGQIANGKIRNVVELCRYDPADNVLGCNHFLTSINHGENKAGYLINYEQLANGGQYSLSTYCTYNCDGYVKDVQYFQSNGTNQFTQSQVASLPAQHNFTLYQGQSISGEIKLPVGQVTNEGFHNTVELCLITQNDQPTECLSTHVSISTGASSAGYSFNFLPALQGTRFQLSTSCYLSCAGFLKEPQFLQPDGTTSFSPATLSTLPSTHTFFLNTGQALNGVIKLPEGQVAQTNIFNSIELCRYTEAGAYLGCDSQNLTIAAGDAEVSYSFNFLPVSSGGYYSLSTRCSDACTGYVTSKQFLQANGSISFDAAETFTIPSVVDFTLDVGQLLNVELRLPMGFSANSQIRNSIALCRYDNSNIAVECTYQSVEIEESTSNASFSFNYAPAPSQGSFGLSTYCTSNCAGYVKDRQYLQADGSIAFIEAKPESLPATIVFTLNSGQALSGEIKLPVDQIAMGRMQTQIRLCVYHEDKNNASDCQYSYPYIEDGESSIGYLFNFLPLPPNVSYQLSAGCAANCAGYVEDRIYLQEDGSLSFDSAQVSSLPAMQDFTLDPGQELSGLVQLPDNEPTGRYIYTHVRLCRFDASGSQIDCEYSNPPIADDATSAPYLFNFLPVPTGGYYEVYATCATSCAGYAVERQYIQLDGSLAFESAQPTSLPTTLDFTLEKGQVLSGTISLPNSELANGFIYSKIQLCRYDGSGNQIACTSIDPVIKSGTPHMNYSLNYIPLTDVGHYELSTYCYSSCGKFTTERRYLQVDGTLGFNSVQLNNIPSSLDFRLYEEYVADRYEIDNSYIQSKPIYTHQRQVHNIHEAGDIDWLTFKLVKPEDVVIEVVNSGDEGNPSMTLYDSELTIIERNDDIIDENESANSNSSRIAIEQLEAGDYYIEVEGFSPTGRIRNYSISYIGPEVDSLCFPIKNRVGNVSLVCI